MPSCSAARRWLPPSGARRLAGELEAVLAACKGTDQLWTSPHLMDEVDDYIHARSWANVHTTYNLLGRTSDAREELVRSEIAPGTYRHTTTERWRVHNGWGSEANSDATIDPYAFFVGRLTPGDASKSDDQKPPKGETVVTPVQGNECTNGQVRRSSCPAGQQGSGILQECINGRWVVTSRACSTGSGGGGSPVDP